jgi:hypothetical protein
MTDQILFDRLAYIDRLIRAGVSADQARAHADAMDAALRESVATKSDVQRLESKIDLAVRDMTIRSGAIAMTLFAALAGIKYFG